MTHDVTANGEVRHRLVGGCGVLVALAALAVHPSDAAADATKPWTRTLQLRLTPQRLGLPAHASARRMASAALRRSARRLGLPRLLAGVRLVRDLHTPSGPAEGVALDNLRFEQTSRGRRVIWSQLDVLVAGGVVRSINATVLPIKRGRPAARAKVTRRRALAIARHAVPGREATGAPQLVTYAGTPRMGCGRDWRT